MSNNNETIFNQNDFVYLKNGDNIESAGYKINSVLLSQGMSPMKTTNIGDTLAYSSSQTGGNVSSLLNDFAVPAGLLLLQQKSLKHYKEDNNDEVIKDDLFDKLIKLATPIKNKKFTKRMKSKSSKSLRKTKRVK
jgi:hypothetical protein